MLYRTSLRYVTFYNYISPSIQLLKHKTICHHDTNQKLCKRTFSNETFNLYQAWYTSPLVSKATESLIWIHDFTSLPWVLSIPLSTILFRTFLVFPLMIYEKKQSAKLINALPQLRSSVSELKKKLKDLENHDEISRENSQKIFYALLKEKKREIYYKQGINSQMRFLVIIVQFPLWIILSSSFSKLCFYSTDKLLQSIRSEGALWFTDLSKLDPYLILPAIFSATLFSNVQYSQMLREENNLHESKLIRIITSALKLWSGFIFFISIEMASGVIIYWISSSLSALIHNIILSYPQVRRKLGISPSPKEMQPITWASIRKRYRS